MAIRCMKEVQDTAHDDLTPWLGQEINTFRRKDKTHEIERLRGGWVWDS
jgi:hypothetical protein